MGLARCQGKGWEGMHGGVGCQVQAQPRTVPRTVQAQPPPAPPKITKCGCSQKLYYIMGFRVLYVAYMYNICSVVFFVAYCFFPFFLDKGAVSAERDTQAWAPAAAWGSELKDYQLGNAHWTMRAGL